MSGKWQKAGEAILSLTFFGVVGVLLYWLFRPPPLLEHIPYQGVELQRDVHYVTSRVWPKQSWFNIEAPSVILRRPVVLKWLTGSGSVSFADQSPIDGISLASQVIVLVHGFSAPEHKVASYFAPFIDALRADASFASTFIVYDWPSTARRFEDLTPEQRRDWTSPAVGTPGRPAVNAFGGVSWEMNAYNADREAAQTAGAAGLIALLQTLRARVEPEQINLIAHSMGSLVVLEAVLKDPSSFMRIRRLVLLAPDLPSDALAPGKVRDAMSGIGQIHVFFSRNDDILWLSRLKSHGDRLGREGPASAATLPANAKVHDMTDRLGAGDAVHGRYLEPAGAVTVSHVLK